MGEMLGGWLLSTYVRYVPDLNAFNHILQNLRRQGFNGRILADRRVHLPAFHALCKIPHLFKHIGVKHLMVNDVGLGADLRMPVMIGAEIDVCAPVLEPGRNSQYGLN